MIFDYPHSDRNILVSHDTWRCIRQLGLRDILCKILVNQLKFDVIKWILKDHHRFCINLPSDISMFPKNYPSEFIKFPSAVFIFSSNLGLDLPRFPVHLLLFINSTHIRILIWRRRNRKRMCQNYNDLIKSNEMILISSYIIDTWADSKWKSYVHHFFSHSIYLSWAYCPEQS
jgi:hypothetical protein